MHEATQSALAKRVLPDVAPARPTTANANDTAGPADAIAPTCPVVSQGAGPCLKPDKLIVGLGTPKNRPARRWPISCAMMVTGTRTAVRITSLKFSPFGHADLFEAIAICESSGPPFNPVFGAAAIL
jgi:hypothetical protein